MDDKGGIIQGYSLVDGWRARQEIFLHIEANYSS